MDRKTLEELLSRAFADGAVEVRGDDGVHFEAHVMSPSFAEKSRVQQHQAVYAALGDLMREAVHALALKTYTPEAWAARGAPAPR